MSSKKLSFININIKIPTYKVYLISNCLSLYIFVSLSYRILILQFFIPTIEPENIQILS